MINELRDPTDPEPANGDLWCILIRQDADLRTAIAEIREHLSEMESYVDDN